jgi:hypothetical protein
MSEGQFLTRRDLREAERKGKSVSEVVAPVEVAAQVAVVAPAEVEVPVANEPIAAAEVVSYDSQPVVEAPAVSNPFLSRRQLREFEKRGIAPSAIVAQPVVETPANVVAEVQQPAPVAQYDEVLAEAEEPITSGIQLFSVSPNLNIEPQTASIVVVPEDPLANLNLHITETGELLKTGSIELPKLSTNTGEISTILDATEVDEAIVQDSISGYVSTIAPLRASGVVNTAGKIVIMPTRLARGQGQIFAVLTASLLMVTVGGLLLAAYMLGLL